MTISEKAMALALADKLREKCSTLRTKPTPLAELIPLLQQSADALAALVEQQPGQDDKDAQRYRWWREYAMQTDDVSADDAFLDCVSPEDVDAVIDAALQSEGKRHD